MSELKKCPFCGGEAKLVGDKYHWVFCEGCQGGSHAFETVEEAIKAWNTRKPVDDVVEALKERKVENSRRLWQPTWNIGIDQAIEIVKEILK